MADKLQLLGNSWSQIATSYRNLFVPRFSPWVDDAIQAFLKHYKKTNGVIFVPGCGTGDEILSLSKRIPKSSFIAMDLSEGMIETAKTVLAPLVDSQRIEFRVGDATRPPIPSISAIFTCFALQQMPNPRQALANWSRALPPDGLIVACFWPTEMDEEGGPWHRLIQVCPTNRAIATWERDLLDGIGEVCDVIEDRHITHEMRWESVEEFWKGMTENGPWHSRRILHGDEVMEEAKRSFMTGKFSNENAPVVHLPRARLIVLKRRRGRTPFQPSSHL